MISKDGEVVPLDNAVNVASKMSEKVWLKELENGMHTTLVKLLQNAVADDTSAGTIATKEGKANFVGWAK
eukprot:15330490-Ditylum_brightwellii.AAC.1